MSCNPISGTCAMSPTYEIGLSYAINNVLFLNEFAKVWTKMLQNGYRENELYKVENDECNIN